jgi:hypothetical protein
MENMSKLIIEFEKVKQLMLENSAEDPALISFSASNKYVYHGIEHDNYSRDYIRLYTEHI